MPISPLARQSDKFDIPKNFLLDNSDAREEDQNLLLEDVFDFFGEVAIRRAFRAAELFVFRFSVLLM